MRLPRILMSAALAVVCCTVLSAQEPEKPRKPAKPNFTPGQLFERFDTNKDGYLSKDEAPERFKDRFERMDQNKDGKLSKEEVQRAFDRIAKPMPPTPGSPRPGAGPDTLFRLLDANEDGKLSREELEKAPELMRRHDRNRDGVLEPQELTPAPPRKPEKPAKPLKPDGAPGVDFILERLDANKDGKVSKEEARGPLAENFERVDRNNDGQLDKQELQMVAERMRAAAAGAKPMPPGLSRPGAGFDELDKNVDGRLSADELKGSTLADKFAEIDLNKDGKIDPKEYEAFLEKARPKVDK